MSTEKTVKVIKMIIAERVFFIIVTRTEKPQKPSQFIRIYNEKSTKTGGADDAFTTYSYDHGGNLLKVILPNNDEIRYTSDALNRRIAKMKNGNYEYKLLYSGQLSPTCGPKSCTKVPIARLNDEDRVVEEYVYGSRG